ncbi:MAG: extensin [Shinella sp.]|nr:MAG: extensin [Shinella sp.]
MFKAVFALAAIVLFTSAAPPPVGPVPPAKPATDAPPVPEPKPKAEAPAAETAPSVSGKDDEADRPAPEDPAELAACLKALTESGATFKTVASKEDAGACGIEQPVELSAPVPGVQVEPPAVLRCAAALGMAEWTRDVVLPAARRAFPDRQVKTLANASSYICRNRNSADTGKVSEHARGNAIDISAIAFSNGVSLPMKPRGEDGDMDGAFQRSVATAACLYFTTVLSPGSDATHQDHLHLDVLKRRGGFRYCR